MSIIKQAKRVIHSGASPEELVPLVGQDPGIVAKGELLHLCVLQLRPAALRALVASCPRVDINHNRRWILLEGGVKMDMLFGQTALTLACTYGGDRWECVQVLVEHGASPFLQDDEGTSPLMYAAGFDQDKYGGYGTILAVVKMLMDAAGPRLHDLFRQQDRKGWGVLHHAAAAGHPRVLARLLECSTAGLEIQDVYGKTPLHTAIHQMRPEAVRELLRHGASPLAPDAQGLLPLDEAIASCSQECVDLVKDAMARACLVQARQSGKTLPTLPDTLPLCDELFLHAMDFLFV